MSANRTEVLAFTAGQSGLSFAAAMVWVLIWFAILGTSLIMLGLAAGQLVLIAFGIARKEDRRPYIALLGLPSVVLLILVLVAGPASSRIFWGVFFSLMTSLLLAAAFSRTALEEAGLRVSGLPRRIYVPYDNIETVLEIRSVLPKLVRPSVLEMTFDASDNRGKGPRQRKYQLPIAYWRVPEFLAALEARR